MAENNNTLLIVDDDKDLLEVTSEFFEYSQEIHDIKTLSNFSQAVNTIQTLLNTKINLVVMLDLNDEPKQDVVSKMPGIIILQELKELQLINNNNLKIFVHSGDIETYCNTVKDIDENQRTPIEKAIFEIHENIGLIPKDHRPNFKKEMILNSFSLLSGENLTGH